MQLFDVNSYAIDDNAICLLASLDNDLAETIINNTKCPKDKLPIKKSETTGNYEFVYEYSITDDVTNEDAINFYASFVNCKILEIGNSFDSLADFIKFIMENDTPASIHNQMTNTYGLPEGSSLEWSVAHFFNQIAMLLTGPAFLWTSIEEDIKNGECVISIKEGVVSEINSIEEYNKLME